MGTQAFAAQYLQTPVAAEGNVIRLAYFERIDEAERRVRGQSYVISIDTANTGRATSDYSVLQVWRTKDNAYALVDQRRGQWDYPALLGQAETLSGLYDHPRMLVEEAGVGYALISDLRRAGCNPQAITPQDSKDQRVARALPAIEGGRVQLPTQASWLGDFEHEVAAFPAGKHDDQVDAMTQFLIWAAKPRASMLDFKPMRLRCG